MKKLTALISLSCLFSISYYCSSLSMNFFSKEIQWPKEPRYRENIQKRMVELDLSELEKNNKFFEVKDRGTFLEKTYKKEAIKGALPQPSENSGCSIDLFKSYIPQESFNKPKHLIIIIHGERDKSNQEYMDISGKNFTKTLESVAKITIKNKEQYDVLAFGWNGSKQLEKQEKSALELTLCAHRMGPLYKSVACIAHGQDTTLPIIANNKKIIIDGVEQQLRRIDEFYFSSAAHLDMKHYPPKAKKIINFISTKHFCSYLSELTNFIKREKSETRKKIDNKLEKGNEKIAIEMVNHSRFKSIIPSFKKQNAEIFETIEKFIEFGAKNKKIGKYLHTMSEKDEKAASVIWSALLKLYRSLYPHESLTLYKQPKKDGVAYNIRALQAFMQQSIEKSTWSKGESLYKRYDPLVSEMPQLIAKLLPAALHITRILETVQPQDRADFLKKNLIHIDMTKLPEKGIIWTLSQSNQPKKNKTFDKLKQESEKNEEYNRRSFLESSNNKVHQWGNKITELLLYKNGLK